MKHLSDAKLPVKLTNPPPEAGRASSSKSPSGTTSARSLNAEIARVFDEDEKMICAKFFS